MNRPYRDLNKAILPGQGNGINELAEKADKKLLPVSLTYS